ncbi:MAG: hypothetical protein JSW55_14365 [Chloroflexota bacterium]|nr:MAG: hypothetical protein JSW55_14365 [Chloroflexota bacterium]
MIRSSFRAAILKVLFIASLSWVLVHGVHAQVGNGIYEPADGDEVSGIVVIRGTADHPQFLRYELAFVQDSRPGSGWIVFAQGDQPVRDDALAVWDTTVGQPVSPVFPDGRYRLRLRVVREDYNYDEFFVSQLLITNLSATPSSTATLTQTLQLTPTLPSVDDLELTRRSESNILPTLTPFPTPAPPPTPAGGLLGASDSTGGSDSDEQGGLLDRITSIETSGFGRAFWFGVTIVIYVFVGLALYVLLRAAWRRLRRIIRQRWYQ